MNQNERTEQEVRILACSALWYAWGQIDPQVTTAGLGTDHGFEFQRLYEQLAQDHALNGTSRPSVLSAWRRFVALKSERGVEAAVTVADIRDAA